MLQWAHLLGEPILVSMAIKTNDIPSKEIMDSYLLDKRGRSRMARDYGVSITVVYRWIKNSGYDCVGSKTPVPDDFKDWYLSVLPAKKDCEKRYSVTRTVIDRWIKESDLPYKGKTVRVETPIQEELLEKNQSLDTFELAEYYGVSPALIRKWFREYGISLRPIPTGGTSKEEGELFEFLESIYPGWIRGKKSILPNGRQELDLYHPDLKMAIEYDGTYWHHARKDHNDKRLKAKEAGITLFRINSHEWLYKREVVESLLRSKVGVTSRIYARQCRVMSLSRFKADGFLDKWHLHGAGNSSVALGLEYMGRIVACMTFSKSRYTGGYEWELSRFACESNVTVVGGASRLFTAFVREKDPVSVLTFSDNRIGTGEGYRNLGFVRVKEGAPTYWYYHTDYPGKRHSRQAFKKHLLPKKLGKFDPDLSETENMYKNGYHQYWDCGSDHWVWTKEDYLSK